MRVVKDVFVTEDNKLREQEGFKQKVEEWVRKRKGKGDGDKVKKEVVDMLVKGKSTVNEHQHVLKKIGDKFNMST